MKIFFKTLVFKLLSLDNYLRLLQRSYFILYRLGLLKSDSTYKYHYFVKNLIRKGDTCIDIGANLGYYSILFSKWVGSSGKVYSVEPIPIYNKIFNEIACHHPNITLYPYALGEKEETTVMVSNPKEKYLRTGLLHVYNAKKDGDIQKQKFKFNVKMKRASNLFKELEKIDYIKCDIEGYEYIVLSEMKEIIKYHKPKIQIEIISKNRLPVAHLLSDIGYDIFRLRDNKLVPEISTEIINEGGDFIFIPKSDKSESKKQA